MPGSLPLTIPEPLDSIYRYRQELDDRVPLSRPLSQGDVFAGVPTDPFEASVYALVLTHPCSMRKGQQLREFVLVASVRLAKDDPHYLFQRHPRFMPLHGLPSGDCAASFDEVVSVRTDSLELTRRVACLDDYGIAILQQRHIRHMTRYVVEPEILHTINAPALLELELLEAWREKAFSGRDDEECLALEDQVNRDFEAAFGPYREQAMDMAAHSRIRRQLLAAIKSA